MVAKDGLNFKIIEGNKIEISTSQLLEADTFVQRIAGIETQKANYALQLNFNKGEIETFKKNIEAIEKNISFANEDLEKAYQFLRSNHREDLIKKIEVKVEEIKKTAAQMPQNEPVLG